MITLDCDRERVAKRILLPLLLEDKRIGRMALNLLGSLSIQQHHHADWRIIESVDFVLSQSEQAKKVMSEEIFESFNISLKSSQVINTCQGAPAATGKAKRVMSFVDKLWSIEITGGKDQFEPLTVVGVRRNGLARRAGIKCGDVITHINSTPAENLTLLEAQLEIQESGRSLKLTVQG